MSARATTAQVPMPRAVTSAAALHTLSILELVSVLLCGVDFVAVLYGIDLGEWSPRWWC